MDRRLDTQVASTEMVSWYIDELSRVPSQLVATMIDVFQKWAPASTLEHLDVPALFILGEFDPIVKDAGAKDAARRLRARVHLVPGCGHGVTILRPRECAAAALDFWQAVESGEYGDTSTRDLDAPPATESLGKAGKVEAGHRADGAEWHG
jgi:pimeloyl-ACP methyl ester carboxylesterase